MSRTKKRLTIALVVLTVASLSFVDHKFGKSTRSRAEAMTSADADVRKYHLNTFEVVYIVDGDSSKEHRVRVLNVSAAPITRTGVIIPSGFINTIAGSGATRTANNSNLNDGMDALTATFRGTSGVSLRSDGLLFISDPQDDRIRVVNTTAADITLGGVVITAGFIETLIGTGVPGFTGQCFVCQRPAGPCP